MGSRAKRPQHVVRTEYFASFRTEPSRGLIEVAGERYLLIRASALSVDFFSTIRKMYGNRGDAEAFAIGQRFLFDISHALGMSDARAFHRKMGLTDPAQKLSAGPVLFAHTGWAYVDILPESNPSPDDEYYMAYHHPYSFEADSWIRAGVPTDETVCIMSAGYSSGWCEESYGIALTAAEISCRARGDGPCTFVMAPPHRIHKYLDSRQQGVQGQAHSRTRVPAYFESKRLEEELRAKEQRFRELFQSMSDGVAVYEAIDGGVDFLVKGMNNASIRIERRPLADVLGKRVTEAFPGVEKLGLLAVLRRVHRTGTAERLPAAHYEDSLVSGWRENQPAASFSRVLRRSMRASSAAPRFLLAANCFFASAVKAAAASVVGMEGPRVQGRVRWRRRGRKGACRLQAPEVRTSGA